VNEIIASSPLIKEPMTVPYSVVLIEYDGGKKYSTHIRQDNGSISCGNYFHGPDSFNRAWADWMERCAKQRKLFVDGVKDRPTEWFLFKKEA